MKLALYKQEQDIAKAKADQAYNLESARAQQHVVEQEMEVKVVERQKQIELEEKEITRREKQYDSEVKKKPMQIVTHANKKLLLKSTRSSRSRSRTLQS